MVNLMKEAAHMKLEKEPDHGITVGLVINHILLILL
jgi:hypothetical protein